MDDDSKLPEPTPEALQRKLDEIGFGLAQLVAVTCCGGIMASEGSEVNIMGSITTLVAEEWSLGPFMKGFMTSIVFVGFAVGNLFSGYLGDSFGRRPAILLAYLIIFTAGLLTSFTTNVATMVVIRIFVGLGCGIGFPSVYSLVPEVTPVHLRGVKSAVMIMFMPLGEMYASVGVLIIDKELDGTKPIGYASWRSLVQWSVIPPLLFFGVSLFFLQESPHYLLSKGRIKEMNEVLGRMARWNGVPEVDTDFGSDAPETSVAKSDDASQEEAVFSWLEAVAKLLSNKYIGTTLFLFLAHFAKDFAVFGLNYVFPQYFQQTVGTVSVGLEMLMVSLLATPGVLLASVLSRLQIVGNIASMSLTAGLNGIAAFGLLDFVALDWCAYFVKFFSMAYFIVVVVYTAEVFPTRVRNTAVGLCTGFGRLGSISSPLVFEILKSVTSSFTPWWCMLMVLSFIVALGAPCLLHHETKGQSLEGDDLDRKPLAPPQHTQYSSA